MFGGISAAGENRLHYASHFGRIFTLDVESGDVTNSFGLLPYGDDLRQFSACGALADGTILVADPLRRRVRRFDTLGRQVARIGGHPIPGVQDQDAPGVLDGPCAILEVAGDVWIACAAADLEHAVQRFGQNGEFLGHLRKEGDDDERWMRPRGLASVGDAIYVGESFSNRVHIHAKNGEALNSFEIDKALGRPVRLAHDGFGSLLISLEPSEEAIDEPGLARLDRDGEFTEWVVLPGHTDGNVKNVMDLAVLPDGRFVVMDVPTGALPDVRLQLFSSDGRFERVLVEGEDSLRVRQDAFVEALFAAPADTPDAHYSQAAAHHEAAYEDSSRAGEAAKQYRWVLELEPGHSLAHLAYGRLLADLLNEPEQAEVEFRAAIAAGERESDITARIAECRRARDDVEGAIALLQSAVESSDPPEDYEPRVELLADYILAKAGEDPDNVQY